MADKSKEETTPDSEKLGRDENSTWSENDFLDGVAALEAERESGKTPEDIPPGRRVRLLREEKGLTIGDLAKRSGLDETLLNEIEAGESSPPLGILARIGQALDMKLGTLISAGEVLPYTVVKADQRQEMSRFASQRGTRYGYTYQALAPQKKNRSMEPFLVTLDPVSGEVEPSSHEGEEFIYVLEGSLEVVFEKTVETLEPGDCIYYDSMMPHLVKPRGGTKAVIVAVLYTG